MATLQLGKYETQNALVKLTIVSKIARRTKKAILIEQEIIRKGNDLAGHGERWLKDNPQIGDFIHPQPEWLPLSQVTIEGDVLTVPDWLASKKSLLYT